MRFFLQDQVSSLLLESFSDYINKIVFYLNSNFVFDMSKVKSSTEYAFLSTSKEVNTSLGKAGSFHWLKLDHILTINACTGF